MSISEILASWIREDEPRLFGDILLSRCGKTKIYKASHRRDGEVAEEKLSILDSKSMVREMVKFDAEGNYRPLKTAPTLKDGWLIVDADIEAFYLKIDEIYPAALAGTIRYFQGEITPVSLRETLKRQSGTNRAAKDITDNQANQIMRNLCAGGCLRQIAWPLDGRCPVSKLPKPRNSIPLICSEACTFAVSEASRIVSDAGEKNS